MNNSEFETRMRKFEVYHGLRVPPEQWIVLRVDGRSFHTLTQSCTKPFDTAFHETMVAVCVGLMREFDGMYGYTESDEISMLLSRDTWMFDRSVEKLVSLSAATASMLFIEATVSEVQKRATFDSRVIVLPNKSTVVDYFSWRQSDAARCALNGWAYWTLRDAGLTPAAATRQLDGMGEGGKHDLLMQNGINFVGLPPWQINGVGCCWRKVDREGADPRTGETFVVPRRLLYTETTLPVREAYRDWLQEQILAD